MYMHVTIINIQVIIITILMKASSTVVIWGRATIAGSTASFAET